MGMRTTVQLDDDVVAAVEEVRRQREIGLSQAVNELVRRGLTAGRPRRTFRQQTRALGLRIDVSNVAEALEQLEGPSFR
jgi:Arc/MetJ family transcription regulator